MEILAAIIGALLAIAAGAIGYWLNVFCMQPILRYIEIKHQVLRDFIYYAQVVNPDGVNDRLKKLYEERVLANRKASAELTAAIESLPKWYLRHLKNNGLAPREAAKHLIGYSNARDDEEASQKSGAIRRKLGLPIEE
jgi:hypothetical protein